MARRACPSSRARPGCRWAPAPRPRSVADSRCATSIDELALKPRLLTERPDEVVATLPGSEAGSQEALELVERRGSTSATTSRRVPPRELHPIDAAGRLVQEDLCLVEEREGSWVMTAGSVCFPSHWRIHEKLGHSVATIHGPVHHYDDELRSRVDNFFGRLRVDRPVWRRNVSIHNHRRTVPTRTPRNAGVVRRWCRELWLRSEYRDAASPARTGGVLFTIKTQQCEVDRLRARPDVAQALGAKLAALEPELERRGDRVPFPKWLPGWLAAC